MVKRWRPSAPALISRRRCVLPDWNLNLERPALGTQSVPFGAREQSKLPLPLMRLLSEDGGVGAAVVFTSWDSTMEKEGSWYQSL